MIDRRTSARIVGWLFILASLAAIVGGSLLAILDESDPLAQAAGHESQLAFGVLIEMVCALAVAGIAAFAYPVLRERNEGAAVGYVALRTMEGLLLALSAICALVVYSIATGTTAGAGDAVTVGDAFLAGRDWLYLMGGMVVFGVGSVTFNIVLLRGRFVPGWLAVWGLLGALLLLVRAGMEVFGAELPGWEQAVFAAPIGLQEMVLAVWLIVRGFGGEIPVPAERAPSMLVDA